MVRKFLTATGACNAVGGTQIPGKCWLNSTTTPLTIISTSGASNSSTSTVSFRVYIPANPSPAVVADTYVATTTLTLTDNP